MHFLLDAVKILADEGRHFICFIVGGGGSSSQRKIDILQQRAEALGISQYLIFTGWREAVTAPPAVPALDWQSPKKFSSCMVVRLRLKVR